MHHSKEVLMARKDKLIQEYIHDPYFAKTKHSEPSVCEKCGVVFNGGIFVWMKPIPENADTMVCPACKRISDNYEGGIVYLEGDFLTEHKAEIMNTIRNVESDSKKNRPLNRIIEITEQDKKLVVKTTYEHLAKKIGNALHRAYKGDFKTQYLNGEKYVRVWWSREY